MPIQFSTNFHGSYQVPQLAKVGGGGFPQHRRGVRVPAPDRGHRADAPVQILDLHMHPWVPDCSKRLVQGSVRGLEAADTDYGAQARRLPRQARRRPVPAHPLQRRLQHRPVRARRRHQRTLPGQGPRLLLRRGLRGLRLGAVLPRPAGDRHRPGRKPRCGKAQAWFHYVFDPTDDSRGDTPDRFWKVRPFQSTHVELVTDILTNLSTGQDPQLRQDTINCIGAWKNLFRPHLVARYRPTAYMFKTVMAYLDNLVDWGDSLFRPGHRRGHQ